ncbi:MAG: glycosyl transferase [Sphingobium sp.]|uniref:glycosyltransferase family 2 protein n=1 Tax=Sphingobium sp. TaxID=1912891 RepID=UPI000DB299C7|nr:glycosyltransferase [Sphingobium sp.]PZU05389.1 MAG: glycosyl transferase [Sphingobium sp.]PZU67058.1 MAG: glycosyl transferase [Rhizobium sp.]
MAEKLSVLTLVKNRERHLANLVRGLERSEARLNELIVVDMGSSRPVTVQTGAFPVDVVRMEGGALPLAAARNLAASKAAGDHLLFLDVDCIPSAALPRAIDVALSAHDALVCGEVRYLGPGQADGDWREDDLLSRGKPHPARPFPTGGIRIERNYGLFWSLAFGIRAKTFRNLGGFDETFTGYGAEDTDFGFRAEKAGVPLLFQGGTCAFHQHHATYDPPLQHFEDIVRNAGIFFDRWSRWPMDGWLRAFEDRGLVAWSDDRIDILRRPVATEIAGTLVTETN